MFTAIDTLVNGRERFRAHQIEYKLSEKNKSEIYRDALPGLNSGKFELLDHPKLVAQICALERRTARGGRDSIDHPPKQHDDLANSALDAAGSTPRFRREFAILDLAGQDIDHEFGELVCVAGALLAFRFGWHFPHLHIDATRSQKGRSAL
jgi:hypothetical protein